MEHPNVETAAAAFVDPTKEFDADISDDPQQLVRGVLFGLAFSLPLWGIAVALIVAMH